MYVEVSKDYPLTYQINYYLMRKCNKCNEEKSSKSFHKHASNKDGLYPTCKDCKRKQDRKRYKANRKKIIARVKSNYDPEKKSEYDKDYRTKNKTRIQAYQNKWYNDRYHSDPSFNMQQRLRTRTRNALNGLYKSAPTLELLGCTAEHARFHIESQFTDGMTWDNIHIDHIQPCASFDLTNPTEQRKCFHYTNLQPLLVEDNLRKSDQIVPEHQVRLL